MKLIVRADDVGYTNVCNIGAFETIYNGVTTAADLMLDTPGAVDAMERLKELPWISVGWHGHFWGSPVLDPSAVPTMYNPQTGHFRTDLNRAEDVSYDECIAEMRAQMDRCAKIMGRVPDTGMAHGESPFSRAMKDICKEYGIVTDFAWQKPFFSPDPDKSFRAPAQFADRKIYMGIGGGYAMKYINNNDIKEHVKYDPLPDLFDGSLLGEVPEDGTGVFVLHPGYVDHYVTHEGDQGPNAPNYLIVRPVDVYALCSQEIKNWIKENKIELCSFTDALYGNRKYQNHLRAIGSDLYMG